MKPGDINDLMTTALEGGINYWCRDCRTVSIPEEYKDKIEYTSDVIGYGGTLELQDIEEPYDRWFLTKEKFLKGIAIYMKENNILSEDDLIEDHDAYTADAIIQYALFDEIIFG